MAEGVKRGRGNEDGDNYSKVQKTDKIRVKFLVPIYTAGAIIGEKGAEIKKLKEETSAQVHISEVNEFFPGTRERVVLCSGSFTSVLEVFKRINHKLRHEELPDKKGTLTQRQSDYAEKRRSIMKVLVPAGVAGQVVGKKGESVKKLQEECGVKIDVTPNHKAIFNLNERAVDVSGEEESVNDVGARLLTILSEEPEARMSGSLIYSGYCAPDDMQGGQQGGQQWNNQGQGYGIQGGNQGGNWGNQVQAMLRSFCHTPQGITIRTVATTYLPKPRYQKRTEQQVDNIFQVNKKQKKQKPPKQQKPPKLWAVTLIKPLPGNPRILQRIATQFDLQLKQPVPLPNIPTVNEKLIGLGDMIYVQPLVIAPNPYPYAEHPRMGTNGVFYPSADSIDEIHELMKR